MKSFRTQFIECNKNGTIMKCEAKTPKVLTSAFHNILFVEKEVNFCTKYLKQCTSRVCLEERKL